MPRAENPKDLFPPSGSSQALSSKLTTSVSFPRPLPEGRDLSRPYAPLRAQDFLFNISSRQNPRLLLEDSRTRLVEAQAESYELGIQEAQLQMKVQTLSNDECMVEAHRDMKREETWKLWVLRGVLLGVLRMWESIVG